MLNVLSYCLLGVMWGCGAYGASEAALGRGETLLLECGREVASCDIDQKDFDEAWLGAGSQVRVIFMTGANKYSAEYDIRDLTVYVNFPSSGYELFQPFDSFLADRFLEEYLVSERASPPPVTSAWFRWRDASLKYYDPQPFFSWNLRYFLLSLLPAVDKYLQGLCVGFHDGWLKLSPAVIAKMHPRGYELEWSFMENKTFVQAVKREQCYEGAGKVFILVRGEGVLAGTFVFKPFGVSKDVDQRSLCYQKISGAKNNLMECFPLSYTLRECCIYLPHAVLSRMEKNMEKKRRFLAKKRKEEEALRFKKRSTS